jgi:hypothetical protein
MDVLVELRHMYVLSDWLLMKENIRIRGNELYRQKKDIILKLCNCLPMMPTSGTKESLIIALKNYIFSNEQLQEMIRYQEQEKSLLNHEFRRRRVETLINGPRPYEYRTQIAIDFFEEDDAKLTHF